MFLGDFITGFLKIYKEHMCLYIESAQDLPLQKSLCTLSIILS